MNLRTPAATKLVGGFALAVVAAAGWNFVLSPQTTELAEVRTQIEDTRDQNDVLRLQLVSLQRQEAALEETRRTAAALAAKVPPTADQPGLFRAVTATAAEAGIPARDVTALTPTPPVIGATSAGGAQLPGQSTGSELARQTVTIAVDGTYDETQQLLANLEQMDRAYLITSVTSTGGGEAGGFVTTITGDMFVMPPVEFEG